MYKLSIQAPYVSLGTTQTLDKELNTLLTLLHLCSIYAGKQKNIIQIPKGGSPIGFGSYLRLIVFDAVWYWGINIVT